MAVRISHELVREIRERRVSGETWAAIGKRLGIAPPTAGRWARFSKADVDRRIPLARATSDGAKKPARGQCPGGCGGRTIKSILGDPGECIACAVNRRIAAGAPTHPPPGMPGSEPRRGWRPFRRVLGHGKKAAHAHAEGPARGDTAGRRGPVGAGMAAGGPPRVRRAEPGRLAVRGAIRLLMTHETEATVDHRRSRARRHTGRMRSLQQLPVRPGRERAHRQSSGGH